MISHELWQNRFGSDPNIIGRGIRMGSARAQIVGVMQRGFHFPPNSPTHVIVPFPQLVPPAQRKNGWIFGMGRMKPGVTDRRRARGADALSAEFERQYPDQNRGTQYFAEPLRDALVGDTKRPLLLLLAAVAFILLIACVNVGNLLLARSLARRQEMAVRTALGAGWSRLASQVVVEALVLAIAGGLVGVLVAWQAAPALASLVPETARVPALTDVGINTTVLLFSLGASIAAALIFGGLACLSLAGREQRSALAAARGSTSRCRHAPSGRSAGRGGDWPRGRAPVGRRSDIAEFREPDRRRSGLPDEQRPDGHCHRARRAISEAARARRFYTRAFAALEALPEVEHAGVGVVMPLTGNNWTVPFERVDRPYPPASVRPRWAGRLPRADTSRRSAFRLWPGDCSRTAIASLDDARR